MNRIDRAFAMADGGRVTFLQTAGETEGALLEMQVTYAPGSGQPPLHIHPEQEERFEVLRGALWTRIGDEEQVYGPGATFVVPVGTAHTMRPEAPGTTEVRWLVRPALESEAFFRTAWGLDPDAPGARRSGLLRSVALVRRFAREFRLVSPPYALQRVIFALLGPVAVWAGHQMPPRSDAGNRGRKSRSVA